MQDIDDRADAMVSKQDAVMRLAHPQRCMAAWTKEFPAWNEVLGAYTWSRLKEEFQKEGALTPDVVVRLANEDPGCRVLRDFIHYTTADSASTELGGTYATALHWRQLLFPQPQFVIDDELLELLENTDISDDLPMSVLNMPYPRFYVEFGKKRTCSHTVPNTESGLHILEGAYVEEGIGVGTERGLFITFTGSPLGKRNALDDATDSIFLSLGNPDVLIADQLSASRRHSEEISQKQNIRTSPQDFVKHSFSGLKLLIKALLYIGLPEARKTVHPERSRALKDVLAKKNPAKRDKAMRQVQGMSDYILVTAPPPGPTEHSSQDVHEGPSMKAHWRRGHYRLQPHGPQSSLRKVVFIRPLLIGSHNTGAPKPPQYRVV